MDELVEQYLWSIVSAVEPTAAQKEGARQSHRYLKEVLKTGNIGPRIKDSFLSGSYARDTAIRPIDDVDIIFVIEPSYWQPAGLFILNPRPAPSIVLQTFSNAIRYRYPVSSVYGQRRSVRLSLYHLDIDVVPAISLDSASRKIVIPDSDIDAWIESAPKIHSENATLVNKARSGRFKPLVKLLKAWNSNIPDLAAFKSFCVETIATRLFWNMDFPDLTSGLLYFWDFVSRFGGTQQLYSWQMNCGISWGFFGGLQVPDAAGTNSNTAHGVTAERQRKFSEYAARSRDRLVAATNARYAETMANHIKNAMYI